MSTPIGPATPTTPPRQPPRPYTHFVSGMEPECEAEDGQDCGGEGAEAAVDQRQDNAPAIMPGTPPAVDH